MWEDMLSKIVCDLAASSLADDLRYACATIGRFDDVPEIRGILLAG